MGYNLIINIKEFGITMWMFIIQHGNIMCLKSEMKPRPIYIDHPKPKQTDQYKPDEIDQGKPEQTDHPVKDHF